MMRRIPVVATIVVALAVAAMISLGVWQLSRRQEKEAALARYAANLDLPPIALPAFGRVDESLLFRRVSAFCLQPTAWTTESGRTAAGATGWRHIALCRTGAEGPGFAVNAGVSQASTNPAWRGGEVSGRLTWMPSDTSLIGAAFGRLFGRAETPPTPMIVADRALAGLQPSVQPDPADIPDNHLAYAIQWFLFAGVAVVIYGILLWRRVRDKS